MRRLCFAAQLAVAITLWRATVTDAGLPGGYSSASSQGLTRVRLTAPIEEWSPGKIDTVEMPVFSSNNASDNASDHIKELKFIHIAKTGGTTIEDVGRSKRVQWGRMHKELGWWHGCFGQKPESLKERFDWFMVVRNPFERIVSEFHCKFGGVGSKARHMSKEQFNKWVIDRVKRQRDTVTLDMACGHYTRQFRYLDHEVPVTTVHFENLNDEFTHVMDMYYPNQFNGLGKTHSMRVVKTFTIFDLDDEALDLIRSFYSQDFDIFGYDPAP